MVLECKYCNHTMHGDFTHCPNCQKPVADKKEWVVEVYELGCASYVVEADSVQEAIEEYKGGNGEFLESSADFIEIAEDKGFNGIREVMERGDIKTVMRFEQLNAMREAGELE